MIVTQDVLDEIALSREEHRRIVDLIGREPTEVELGLFGAMWSEHCGYKNSKALLRRLPTTGSRVLQGPGENAGAVDIGDGLAVVMKVESHNHPSAVEPFQGAATGVGGIIRDIFTMGARPIALLDSLRFGALDNERSEYLFKGVVGGISFYGNCIGVPTVGGEIYFEPAYAENPLVNVMAVGLIETDKIVRSRAELPGDGAASGWCGYRTRRHTRRLRPGFARIERQHDRSATHRSSRQPVSRKAPDRGLSRTPQFGQADSNAGSGRSRHYERNRGGS